MKVKSEKKKKPKLHVAPSQPSIHAVFPPKVGLVATSRSNIESSIKQWKGRIFFFFFFPSKILHFVKNYFALRASERFYSNVPFEFSKKFRTLREQFENSFRTFRKLRLRNLAKNKYSGFKIFELVTRQIFSDSRNSCKQNESAKRS